MKKLLLFILVVGCVCSSFAFENKKDIFCLPQIDSVCFVCESQINGCFDSVCCGDKVFSYCTLEEAKKVDFKQKIDSVELFFANFDLKQIETALDLQLVATEKYENFDVILGYTTHFDKVVYVNGKKVNVQLAVYEDKLIAGFPMILTGY